MIYLFESQSSIYKDREWYFISAMAAMVGAEPGCSQEPGSFPQFPVWVYGW